MRFIERFKTLAQQETPAERNQRMLPGALYGLVIASIYTIIDGVINPLSFPDLPVGVHWRSLLLTWLFLSVWLGVGGGFINWFTQTEEGLVISMLVMTGVALGVGATSLEGNLPTQLSKLLLAALPVMVVGLLATLTLRWLGVRHAELLEKEQPRRIRGILTLTAIALILGGLTGIGLNRWSGDTLRAVQEVHRRLQTAGSDPSRTALLFPLADLPGLEAHLGVPYTLHGKPSGQSVVGVETRIDFQDGYEVACILLVFPDTSPFLNACAEGEKVFLQQNQ